MTAEHQRAVIFCLNQLGAQLLARQQTSNTNIDIHMKMETSDVVPKVSPTSSLSTTTENQRDDYEHFYEMIKLFSNTIHTLNDEFIRLNSEWSHISQSVETTDKVLPTIKTSVEESSSVVDAMRTNLTILRQELSSLQQKYEEKQVISFDGTLIWKITQFNQKMSKHIFFAETIYSSDK